jgi:hypothetical protein
VPSLLRFICMVLLKAPGQLRRGLEEIAAWLAPREKVDKAPDSIPGGVALSRDFWRCRRAFGGDASYNIRHRASSFLFRASQSFVPQCTLRTRSIPWLG